MTVGLTGQQATSAVGGVVLDQIVISPTGQSVTAGVGSLIVGIGVPLTGQVATSGVMDTVTSSVYYKVLVLSLIHI